MASGFKLGLGLSRRGGGTSLSAFAPILTLSADAGVFQDTGGATPASANDDPVARWNDTVGAKAFSQATAGSRPLLKTVSPSLSFDGTDDHLVFSGSLVNATGSVVVAFTTPSGFSSDEVLFSGSDTATANNWFEIGLTGDGKFYVSSNAGGTIHRVVGSSFLQASTSYILLLVHDGVDYYAQIGSTEQNPLIIETAGAFAWFGDVSGADSLTVGGTVTSGGLARPFSGEIMRIDVYAEDITA